MPGSSKAKHPSGVEIEFFEDTHKYLSTIAGKEIEYISGTTFLGKFFKPFDADGSIARRCAARDGLTVEEVKSKWAKAGKDACTLGTKIHECCEDVELGRPIRNTPNNERERRMIENATAMAKKFYDSLDIIGVEKIVFSPSLKIAGTIDLLARSRKDGTYIIGDWKTNKSIELEDKWGNFALRPIEHIQDCSGTHYGLQLSLYEYLLRREKYVPREAKFKRILGHVTEEKTEIIPLPDYSIEIRDMMIAYLCGEL